MPEKNNSNFQYLAVAILFFIGINYFFPIPHLEFLNEALHTNDVQDKAIIALVICFLLAMCFTDVLTQLSSFTIGVVVFTFEEWLPQPLLIIVAFIIALVVYKIVRS